MTQLSPHSDNDRNRVKDHGWDHHSGREDCEKESDSAGRCQGRGREQSAPSAGKRGASP